VCTAGQLCSANMGVGVREWFRASAIEVTIYQHRTYHSLGVGPTFQQHPAVRSWQLVKPVQDRNCQSEKSLSGQLSIHLKKWGTRTVRLLDWMSRKDGALAFRICDHSRLGYTISEIRDSKGRTYGRPLALIQ
jgi:hypothetical protein